MNGWILILACMALLADPSPRALAEDEVKFPSLTLRDCFELALQRSETVAIQKEEIEVVEAQFFNALSEALGDADFVITDFRQDAPKPGASGTSSDSSLSSTSAARHRRERKFLIAQPIFQGFKSLGALKGAGSLKKQREEEKIRAEQLLFLDVARAFYDLFKLKRDAEILGGIHKLLVERLEDLSEREKIGRSRLSELATAKARLKILEADLARSRGALAVARQILEFLTGIPLDPSQLAEESLEEEKPREAGSYVEKVVLRPDVKAAEQAARVAWNSVVVAQSGLWPELTLENNQYVKREGFQSGFDWDLTLKLDVPLFRGGETIGKVKQALAQYRRAKLVHSRTKREATLDIQQAYQDWISSLERFRALQEALTASEENFKLQKEEYTRNLVSNLDVLDALESLNETGRQTNQAYYEMKANYWRLRVATGEIL